MECSFINPWAQMAPQMGRDLLHHLSNKVLAHQQDGVRALGSVVSFVEILLLENIMEYWLVTGVAASSRGA